MTKQDAAAPPAEPVAVCPCTCLTPCAQDCHCYDPYQDGCCQKCDGSGMLAAAPAASTAQPVALLRELREVLPKLEALERRLNELTANPKDQQQYRVTARAAVLLARWLYNKFCATSFDALATPAPAGWRGIESAPRDERKVIIVGGHYGGAWHTEFSDSDDIRRWMTHWMPLPAAPDSSAATTPDDGAAAVTSKAAPHELSVGASVANPKDRSNT